MCIRCRNIWSDLYQKKMMIMVFGFSFISDLTSRDYKYYNHVTIKTFVLSFDIHDLCWRTPFEYFYIIRIYRQMIFWRENHHDVSFCVYTFQLYYDVECMHTLSICTSQSMNCVMIVNATNIRKNGQCHTPASFHAVWEITNHFLIANCSFAVPIASHWLMLLLGNFGVWITVVG